MKKPLLLIMSVLMIQPATESDLWSIYQQAADGDPGLRAAAATRDAALETRPQALAGLLPSFALSGSYQREMFDPRNSGNTSFSTNQNYTLGLNQAVFRYDRFVQLQQADHTIAQAEAQYSNEEQNLIVRVAEAYFNVLAAKDNLRFAKAENQAISRQLDQAQQRFEVGLTAITDVHEAKARYDLSVSTVILAENQLASAQDSLREMTGAYPQPLLAPHDLTLQFPDPKDPAAWVTQALDGNMNLLASTAGVQVARDEIRRQKAGHLPTLDLQAGYSYQDLNFGGIVNLERNDATLGLQFNIPIYQGGLVSSQSRAAQYRFVASKEQLETLKRSTERQTRDAYRGVVSGIAQVKALEQSLVSTETALEAAEAGFEVGTRTIVDVLNAQRERYRAERDLYRARYDYLLNTLRLKQAAGSLAPRDIETMNHWFNPAS